jgi:hypothetical protein
MDAQAIPQPDAALRLDPGPFDPSPYWHDYGVGVVDWLPADAGPVPNDCAPGPDLRIPITQVVECREPPERPEPLVRIPSGTPIPCPFEGVGLRAPEGPDAMPEIPPMPGNPREWRITETDHYLTIEHLDTGAPPSPWFAARLADGRMMETIAWSGNQREHRGFTWLLGQTRLVWWGRCTEGSCRPWSLREYAADGRVVRHDRTWECFREPSRGGIQRDGSRWFEYCGNFGNRGDGFDSTTFHVCNVAGNLTREAYQTDLYYGGNPPSTTSFATDHLLDPCQRVVATHSVLRPSGEVSDVTLHHGAMGEVDAFLETGSAGRRLGVIHRDLEGQPVAVDFYSGLDLAASCPPWEVVEWWRDGQMPENLWRDCQVPQRLPDERICLAGLVGGCVDLCVWP